MKRYVRTTLLFCAITSACIISATAQRTEDNPERSEPAPVVSIAPLDLRGSTVREPLWTLAAPDAIVRVDADAPVVSDGAAFFGNRYGNAAPLGAIDVVTGKLRWQSDVMATPLASTNGIVFGATANVRRFETPRVVAFDARSGRLRWSASGSWIAIERQLAIVVDGSRLQGRDAVNGRLRWNAVWNGYQPHAVALFGTTLLLQTVESGATMVGVLYAYDARDGRALWTTKANAILGAVPGGDVALDTTWLPGAFGGYAPLSVAIVSVSSGVVRSSYQYAPDRERWHDSTEHDVRFAQDAAVDTGALMFRIGSTSVYRYALEADPATTAGTRYELGSLSNIAAGISLVRSADGGAALARFDPKRATLQSLAGLDDVEFTSAHAGLAFVAARDRAIVLDPLHLRDAVLARFPCSAVVRAVLMKSALVVVCSAPEPKLVALPLPSTYAEPMPATPLPLRTQPTHEFTVAMEARTVPTRFTEVRGAAFAADGTLWFCEHATFDATPDRTGHTDRIGHVRANGAIEEFPVPTVDAQAGSIARGPDGAMWFTEASALKLGRIASDGAIVEYPLPPELFANPPFASPTAPATPLSDPANVSVQPRGRARTFFKLGGVVAGSDHALWLTAPYADAIVRMTTGGAVHIFRLPAGLTRPGALTLGPDGAVWFTASGAIGRVTPDGVATRFAIETRMPLTSIVWGPDGNVWFSFVDGRVGRIAHNGALKVFAAPVVAAPSGPLIGGCDGNLYVADPFRAAVWRVTQKGEFEQHDVTYAIGHLARAPDCKLGFTEAQAPATAHVGTLSL